MRGMGSRPTAGSGAAGTDGPSFDVAAWVVASCEAQGIPVKVTDARVIARVAVLFGAPAAASEPPDRLNPGRVEGAGPGTAGDHGMVEDRGDDRVTPIETEGLPVVS